jgi:hypothetical protein
LLAALWIAAPAGQARAASDSNAFSQLVTQYLSESEARDPLFAGSIGVHTYDDKLPDLSPSGVEASYRWERAWRARFTALAEGQLSPGERADRQALLDGFDADLLESTTVRPYNTNPGIYTGAIGDAVYQLTGRDFAPLDQRLGDVAKRLPGIPDIVRAAEASLTHPTPAAAELAIQQNQGNIDLYEHDLSALVKDASPRTRAAIEAVLPAAIASLKDLQAFLAGPIRAQANGNPRVGAQVFDAELRLVDGTDTPRAVIVARAKADFAATRKRMLALALPLDRKFFPQRVHTESGDALINAVVGEVLDKLADAHPQADQVFAAANGDLTGIEAFLTADPVVVLPKPGTLRVMPTPEYAAGIAGAGLESPGPFSPLENSYYYIDRIPASWSPERVRSYLRENNDYEMRILSIHEAIPGHYVQFRYNALTPSIVRRVWGNGSFIEGWAVYGEGMMLDAGYGGGDPALRLFQLKWRLREYANAIIDAEFHAGGLTEQQLFDLLEHGAFQEHAEAQTKWNRLQLSHDQLSSYFVGLDAILEAQRGASLSMGVFNRKLLEMGSVEPRFIAPLLTNAP